MGFENVMRIHLVILFRTIPYYSRQYNRRQASYFGQSSTLGRSIPLLSLWFCEARHYL